MKTIKGLAPALALAIVTLASPFASPATTRLAEPTLQDPRGSRKPACGCYVCGTLDFIVFANKAADCAGILAEDTCSGYMGSNDVSPEMRRSFCNQVLSRGCKAACDSPNGKYCGDNTARSGSLYASTGGRVYSEPSTNSTVVDGPPIGARLRYTNTTQVNGQTWYYVQPPGRPSGWISGSQLSCTRPEAPPLPKRIQEIDSALVPAGTTVQIAGSRG